MNSTNFGHIEIYHNNEDEAAKSAAITSAAIAAAARAAARAQAAQMYGRPSVNPVATAAAATSVSTLMSMSRHGDNHQHQHYEHQHNHQHNNKKHQHQHKNKNYQHSSHRHHRPFQDSNYTRFSLTRVNGNGLWNSWTRNFKSPLLALLDLLDNAFDAALLYNANGYMSDNGQGKQQQQQDDDDDEALKGKIQITSKLHRRPRENNVKAGTSSSTGTLCDLILTNSCQSRIKPLDQVLEVYRSSKAKKSDSIGENGVGLKQGCATLSDLSFCLTRNGQLYSLGILAKSLQRQEGCYLPSFVFDINVDDNDDDQQQKQTQNGSNGNHAINLGSSDNDDSGKNNDNNNDRIGSALTKELQRLFVQQNRQEDGSNYHDIAACIVEFGFQSDNNSEDDNDENVERDFDVDLQAGIQRLVYHMRRISTGEWAPFQHVFCIVLHGLKHGGSTSTNAARRTGKSSDSSESDEDNNNEDEQELITSMVPASADKRRRTASITKGNAHANHEEDSIPLVKELLQELPRHYIHIPPPPHISVKVNSTEVKFGHWQERLVELTRFRPYIDPKHSYRSIAAQEDWDHPVKRGYPLDVYLGFDPYRAAAAATAAAERNPNSIVTYPKEHDDNENNSNSSINSTAALYIYSRQSGRLIKMVEDARALLGLPSSGSDFKQGLTIIVNDAEGRLPLNPTKQDLAFGEEVHGAAHECNLYAWTGAITTVYYRYHLKQFENSKTLLGTAIQSHLEQMGKSDRKHNVKNKNRHRSAAGAAADNGGVKNLPESEFTTFRNLAWRKNAHYKIFSYARCLTKVEGPDTAHPLLPTDVSYEQRILSQSTHRRRRSRTPQPPPSPPQSSSSAQQQQQQGRNKRRRIKKENDDDDEENSNEIEVVVIQDDSSKDDGDSDSDDDDVEKKECVPLVTSSSAAVVAAAATPATTRPSVSSQSDDIYDLVVGASPPAQSKRTEAVAAATTTAAQEQQLSLISQLRAELEEERRAREEVGEDLRLANRVIRNLRNSNDMLQETVHILEKRLKERSA